MKTLGRVIVVVIVVAAFTRFFLYMKNIESLSDKAELQLAVEKQKREVIIQHACSKDFFSSCVNLSPDVCERELLGAWEKCAAEASSSATPNDPGVIGCSMTAFTTKYPVFERRSDPTCLEPPALDNEKMKRELEERIANMQK